MKLWIFGGSGTLGRHVVAVAREQGHEVFAPTRATCSIDRHEHVTRLFATAEAMKENGPRLPDAMINCADVINKYNREGMIVTNGLGPHNLAHLGIRLIHMSTDCVFSGRDIRGDTFQHPLESNEYPDPNDIYGRSKLLGEPEGDHVAVVRGSFIDPDGGFLKWLLEAHGKVQAWMHAYWNGTSARRMAEELVRIAGENGHGIFHVAAPDYVAKAWLIEYFVEQLDLPVTVIEFVREPAIWRVLEASPGYETVPVKEMCDELIKEIQHAMPGS